MFTRIALFYDARVTAGNSYFVLHGGSGFAHALKGRDPISYVHRKFLALVTPRSFVMRCLFNFM